MKGGEKMTLISQSVVVNSSSKSKDGTTTGKVTNEASVNVTEGSVPGLDLSFSQLLGGEIATTQGTISLSDVTTLLEGLLQNASLKEVPEADALVQLLQGLNEDLDKLDDAIKEDPALMVILQGWLQQVTTFLNSVEVESQNVNQEESAGLSVLAEHSSTIRFSLQDGLSQLVALLQNKTGSVNNATQTFQLLASFQNILQEAGVVDKQSTSAQNRAHVLNNMNVVTPTTSLLVNVDSPTTSLLVNAVTPTTSLLADTSVKTVQGTLPTQSNQTNITLIEEHPTVDQDESLSSSQGTLTVGELVIREGIKNPLKVAAASVPVEQFAKEMTSFVVNKLDIVKQNGMTEAKISLYPEHLGQVDIKITMLNGQVVATFITEHSGAKELLEQQMSQLRIALQSQGLQVEKLEVTQNQSLESHMYQEGRQSNAGQQQTNQRAKERDGQMDDSLVVAELTEEWNDWISERVNPDKGNAFTAKA